MSPEAGCYACSIFEAYWDKCEISELEPAPAFSERVNIITGAEGSSNIDGLDGPGMGVMVKM